MTENEVDEYLAEGSTRGDLRPAEKQGLSEGLDELADPARTSGEELDALFEGELSDARARDAAEKLRERLEMQEGTEVPFEDEDALLGASAIPPEFEFPGYDPANPQPPLDVDNRQFETLADAMGYARGAAMGKYRSKLEKAPLPSHVGSASEFRYDLRTTASEPIVALFSDFGNGLPHTHYIARQLTGQGYDCLIHLGDIYYAGESNEFKRYFIDPLRPSLATVPLFTLNSNHEMFSGGYAYFGFIKGRRDAHPGVQLQEGSYFALNVGSEYQIVAIDTDYYGNGRYERDELVNWATRMLAFGRSEGRKNIFLSANEPIKYGKKGTTSLYDDLELLLPDIDLWFWGNTHYCALFEEKGKLPLSSCIGHGGYPYRLKEYDLHKDPGELDHEAPVHWVERGGRYPEWTKLRPEVGNNGYCYLEFKKNGRVSLVYRDWMSRERCVVALTPRTSRGFDVNVVYP